MKRTGLASASTSSGRRLAPALFAALAGCAGQPTVEEYVVPASGCCDSVSAITFRALPAGHPVEFNLTADAPTYRFSGERRHFVAFSIPSDFSATTIQVTSFLTTAYLPKATAVLPDFLYLDADKQVLGRSSTRDFQSAAGFWRSGVAGRAEVPAGTRYVIVFAGKGDAHGGPTLLSGNGTPWPVRAAAIGDFSLRLFGAAR